MLQNRAEATRQGYYFASAQDHYQQLFEVARAELPLDTAEVAAWLQRPAAQRAPWLGQGGLRATAALLLLEQAARQREELRARDQLKRTLGTRAQGADPARDTLMALLHDTGQLVSPAALVPGGGYGLPLGSERAAAAASTAAISARGVPAWQQLQQQLRARLPAAQQQELVTIENNLDRLGARMRTLAREETATDAAVR